jgi:hypothetical protein
MLTTVATLNVTSVACEFPVRDKHAQFDILAITLIAITGIVVGLRVLHKLHYERKFRLDDYLVVAVFVSLYHHQKEALLIMIGAGFGQHYCLCSWP